MSRNPADVIEQILQQIPEGKHLELRRILIAQQQCATYAYESGLIAIMATLGRILHQHLGTPDTPWKLQISAIVAGKPLPNETKSEIES